MRIHQQVLIDTETVGLTTFKNITTMRTAEVKVFQYDELSDKAKQVAREWWLSGGLDYEWWDSVFDDAENVGIKILAFDTDRGNYCDIKLKLSAVDVAKAIIESHGPQCDTYKTAQAFLQDYQKAESIFDSDENNDGCDFAYEDDAYDLGEEFKKAISEDYLSMLRKEYEYLVSDEKVEESIRCNEYEFTEDGKRF